MSYKKAIGVSVFLTVALALPLGVYLTQQETKLDSQAAYVKPKPAVDPKASPGPIPAERAEIGRVFPWVGKVGDAVWVQGKNFGVNPGSKELRIGGVKVAEGDISAWEDDLIEAIIPEGAAQGGIVEIKIGNYNMVKSLPYVLYDQMSEVKLGKRDGKVIVDSGSSRVDRAIIWTGDDEITEEKHEVKVNFAGDSKTIVFDTRDLPLKTILLFDSEGKLLPYFVDVIEFDF